MANLNLDILQQSVEKLSREYEKNLLDSERDQLSLKRASALLEGLKGIFGIDDLSLIAAGNLFCISVVIDDYNLEIYVDPSQDLKLQSVQAKCGGNIVDTSDVMGKCSCLSQPNDIRQALYLLREKIVPSE